MTRVIPRPLEPALLLGDARRLGAVARPDLLHRRRQMVANGALGERQRNRDVGDGIAGMRSREDLALTRRERALALGQRRRGKARVDDAIARDAATDRPRELLRRRVLEQEAGRA